MASNTRRLRSGYTTGACAAAAAKAAVMLLLPEADRRCTDREVEIPFPDGKRVAFSARLGRTTGHGADRTATASVIKDGGDDPDVTNGAEITATARIIADQGARSHAVVIKGGKGVGIVTKPGLSVPVGEPAINRVPQSMIREAVAEVFSGNSLLPQGNGIEITISVPQGEALARKTLNARLGIIGGISILGTSGIVHPLSADAWTATITASMDVAKASGITEIVLSVGRISEKAHMKKYGLPEEAYVMMGDHVEFSLNAAARRSFKGVHISAQWAKMLKIAMSTPQTHVRHGAIDTGKAAAWLMDLGVPLPPDRHFNTAREIYDELLAAHDVSHRPWGEVCAAATEYARKVAGAIPVTTHLVSYDGGIIGDSEENLHHRHRV
jgi:cobalt-precorrin-5B (C1)-methyltransferase